MDSIIFVILLISSEFFYSADAISCIKCKNVNSIFNPKEESNCFSQECKLETDSCFVHIANRTVRVGCLKESLESLFSENGINLIDDCKDKYTCQLCSDRDNCNDIDIFDETCIDCHTETNLNCSYVPDEEMSRTCQLSLEPMGCYLLKSGLAYIKRGCMSELDEFDREICLKEGSKCITCISNNCNLKMEFQSCHSCNSRVDGEKCVSSGRDTKTKLCRNHLADCFINVENNTVSRGCLGEDMPKEDCISGKCKTCSRFSDCNSANTVTEKCISCDSITDSVCQLNATLFANQACQLSAGSEGCYHYIGDNGHHIRGCVSSLKGAQKHECQRNSTNCKTCFGNNCNLKTAFSRCMSCNGQSDPNCIEHHDKASIKTCDGYDDECYVITRKNLVQRGCLQEMFPEFIAKCQAPHMHAKCQICKSNDGSACNIYDLTDKCIECDSSNNMKCRDDPVSTIERICSVKRDKSAGCYLYRDGDTFKRGCVEDLVESYQHQCYEQTQNCKSCFGKNCNTIKDYKTCYVCNSKDDPYCGKVSESTDTSTCLNYLSSCVTAIKNGYTYRNCTENVVTTEKTVKNEFEICLRNKCNEKIFPPQRLQCYQCSGSKKCQNIDKNSNVTMEPCKFYSELDQCYTLLADDNTVHRGCISDLDTNRFLCDKDGAICKKCNESGCNDRKPDSQASEVESSTKVESLTDVESPTGIESSTKVESLTDVESPTEIEISTEDEGSTISLANQNSTESTGNSGNKLASSSILITLFLFKCFENYLF